MGRQYGNWRPQGTEKYLMFFTRSGCGYHRTGAGTVVYSEPGDLVMYFPRACQDYGTVPGRQWDFHWVNFIQRPSWSPYLRWPQAAPGIGKIRGLPPSLCRKIEGNFRELHRDVRIGGPVRTELAFNLIERLLLLVWEYRGAGKRPLDPRVQQTVERIAARPFDRYTIPVLARSASLSPSRFSGLFKDEMGMPAIEYILRVRLREGERKLLLTRATVADIAYATGFNSPFYFASQFRKRYGQSPRAFRNSSGRGGRNRSGRSNSESASP